VSLPSTDRHTVELRHVKATLALHRLRQGADDARPLLVLHGLGERTPPTPPPYLDAWPGPVWGLDFTGHGDSSRPRGGGYTAEILLGDADAAIGHLGRATVFGRGLGAYIALLLAGARTTDVRGAILADGPGLAGGGSSPASPLPLMPVPAATVPGSPDSPDPFALAELTRDVRPPDYAVNYARLTLQFSGLDEPLAVVSRVHTPWLDAVAAEPGVVTASIVEAIGRFARVE
jgi:pimeloyl-ACP methyl ester carboxylesterase